MTAGLVEFEPRAALITARVFFVTGAALEHGAGTTQLFKYKPHPRKTRVVFRQIEIYGAQVVFHRVVTLPLEQVDIFLVS